MCLNPIKVGHDRYPCGKCYECIKSKQMDYAQMMMHQAVKRHSCHFVTFTYSDRTRPIRCLDRQTGEVSWLDYPNYWRAKYLDIIESYKIMSHSLWRKYIHLELPHLGAVGSVNVISASLRRRDFRLWLKKARVTYERKFGCKLPDFSYFCVGEYGEKTFAPHYHAMFFGLDECQLSFMTALWKRDYGFVYTKQVPVMSSQDVSRCCMYVAKYMNKGCYDCPELTREDSIMEKPRILCSSGMAVRDGLRSILTLDGRLPLYGGSYDLKDVEQVIGRLKSCFGQQSLTVGKHFYQRALRVPNETLHKPSLNNDSEVVAYQITYAACYEQDKVRIYKQFHEPSKSKFKASPLQVAISYVLSNMARSRDNQERREHYELFEASADLREVYSSFEDYWSSILSSMQETARTKRQRDVCKSVF